MNINPSNNMEVFYVFKRDDGKEEVSFDKIIKRIKNLSKNLNINPSMLTQKIITEIYDGIKTSEIDILAAQLCASMSTEHPDYLELASRIELSNLHKNTSPSFSETVNILYENTDVHGANYPLISDDLYEMVKKNKTKLNSYIKYDRDGLIDYFGLKTLQKSYLINIKGKIIERPQHMFMRVSLGIHGTDLREALKTYDYMSQKYFIHATPTLFNSGTSRPQLSSCFLLKMKDDSIEGIYDTLKSCALISKWAGGIGLNIHNIRANGSLIRGTNGESNGIIPMLRVFNNTARYVDQGGGKRNGSIAMYLEPWHADVFEFLELRKNTGIEEERARDLFYALWTPDLFMERVQNDGKWTLMCPDECPGLQDCHGEAFQELYERYEREGRGKRTVNASDLWYAIVESQIETGTPYLLYKDACNGKSNQQNLGTIKSSNLCTEIIEYSSSDEFAVCNLASIGLSKYIIEEPTIISDKITVYSIDNCKFCKYTKELLEETAGLKYEIITIEDTVGSGDGTSSKTAKLDELNTGSRTYPQIFVGDQFIGGFQELVMFSRPKYTYDFEALQKIAKIITRNLNKIIDINFYPVPETRKSNFLHRPIGIGVQGLADVFAKFHYAFDSPEAKELNEKIFETIYLGAIEASIEISKKREIIVKEYKDLINSEDKSGEAQLLAKTHNILPEEVNRDKYLGSYSSFIGSPASQGKLQFDLWNEEPSMKTKWNKVKRDLAKYGMRNSLLLAPMPTASTSQILGNNECFEPFTSNIYVRRTLAGEFIVINKHLITDLIKLKLWDAEMKNKIIVDNGSVQNISSIPDYLKNIYKTVWEIGNKTLIDMSADRGKYICQSQSLNLYMSDPEFPKITSMHFYSWRKGLKTGQYYLRTRAAAKAQQFSIEPECESCSA